MCRDARSKVAPGFQIVENHPCNRRHVHTGTVAHVKPLKVLQLGRVFYICRLNADVVGEAEKESRVESPDAPWRRDRTRDITQRREVRSLLRPFNSKAKPRLFFQFAHCRQRQGPRPCNGHYTRSRTPELVDDERIKVDTKGQGVIARVAPATGKHIDVRHEDVAAAALADEHTWRAVRTIDQDQAGRIPRTQVG